MTAERIPFHFHLLFHPLLCLADWMGASNGFRLGVLMTSSLHLILARIYAKASLLIRIDTGFRNSAPLGNITLPSLSFRSPIEGYILRDWESCHFPRMGYQFSMDPKYSMTQPRAQGNIKQKGQSRRELPDLSLRRLATCLEGIVIRNTEILDSTLNMLLASFKTGTFLTESQSQPFNRD